MGHIAEEMCYSADISTKKLNQIDETKAEYTSNKAKCKGRKQKMMLGGKHGTKSMTTAKKNKNTLQNKDVGSFFFFLTSKWPS